ncbi:methyl-accepting chemotaxis protein [Nocardioides thalensis]|uniref:Methyl-accepting chemotaxis protein n=1 Tax=Nocardioides thalensis TaxID=1914755 RepID=A0A853C698_9ACTN|nr:methyl-accepting chemotaxis protein [Nocardioides thalensis]
MTIKQKLWAMAGLAGAIFVVMSVLAVQQMQHAEAKAEEAHDRAQEADLLSKANAKWDASTRDTPYGQVLADSGAEGEQAAYEGVVEDLDTALGILGELAERVDHPAEREIVATLTGTVEDFSASVERQHSAIVEGDLDQARREVLNTQREMISAAGDQFDAVIADIGGDSETAQEEFRSSIDSAQRLLIVVAVVGLLLLLALAFVIIRSITRPLDQIVGSLKAIATGDRTQRVDYDRQDEIGSIVSALDTVVDFLDKADADAAEAERARIAREEADRQAAQAEAERERQRQEDERRAADEQAAKLTAALDEQAEKLQRAAAEQAEAQRRTMEAERLREQEAAQAEAERAAAEAAEAAESARQVAELLDYVKKIVDGDLTQTVPSCTDPNVSQMAEGLRSLTQALRESMAAIGDTAAQVAGASEDLTTVSATLGTGADHTSDLAGNVSSASEEVSASVATVASAAEEMSVSIREIAKNATEASRVASEAVVVADRARSTVHDLGDASSEIGAVIKTITSIAQQTNLLALNATIEAARAGDAGKGFAVVANEVKDLAQETAKATEEIRERIDAIQQGTTGAVGAIGEISEVIVQINEIQTSIAGAVEQQTATTNEIARSVTETATVSHTIAADIAQVAHAAGETQKGATTTAEAAASMASSASQLEKLVGAFRY